MTNPTPYVSRIGMAHRIDRDGVTFLPGESPGNALAQFERWVEKIVQEEVERRLEVMRGVQVGREEGMRDGDVHPVRCRAEGVGEAGE